MRVVYSLLAILALAAGCGASPATAVKAAAADAVNLKVREGKDCRFYRYLWVPDGANDTLIVLKFHLNLLSREADFSTPVAIGRDVVRIDLRELKLQKRVLVWEKLADTDVFFHTKVKALVDLKIKVAWPGGVDKTDRKFYKPGIYPEKRKAGRIFSTGAPWLPQKELYYLRATLLTECPIVFGQWFFVQSARQISIRNKQEGTGYYDFLALKDRNAFFELIGLDEKKAIKLYKEWRAVVDKSGISAQNRQIVALNATTGRAWGTLDTFTASGRGIAKRNLRRGEFAHDAEEWYGVLSNGLMVTFLGNKDGVAQESAPDKIGPDDSLLRVGRDARVHANLSCIRCHGADRDMLKPINDWARKTFRSTGVLRFQEKNKKVYLELKRQYLSDLDRVLARDRSDYVDAIARCTTSKLHPRGLTSPQITKLYGTFWNDYVENGVTAKRAALELGVDEKCLIDALKAYQKRTGKSDLALVGFLDVPAQKLTRLEWEDSYFLAQTIVAGVVLPENLEKVKAK